MSLAVRYANSAHDPLPRLAGMSVQRESDPHVVAGVQGRGVDEIVRRFKDAHRVYVAYLHGDAAAWGWVATRSAVIGELNSAFRVPRHTRYLWNFVTAPVHRGKGVYPRLLDAIVRAEAAEAATFWIAYAPENHASAAGIHKAGFETVARLSFDRDGGPAVIGYTLEAGRKAADLLGLPQAVSPLSQCWRCARKLEAGACREQTCCCDYQRPQIACPGDS